MVIVIILEVLIIGGRGGCGKAGVVVAVFLFFLPARVVILMAIGNRSVGSSWSLRGLSRGPRGRHGRSGHSGRSRRKGNHGRHRNTNTNPVLIISVPLVGRSMRIASEEKYL